MIYSRREWSNVVCVVDVFKYGGEVLLNFGVFFFDYYLVYYSYSFSCFYICMVFWFRKLYWKLWGYVIKEYYEIKMFIKISIRFINIILYILWFGSLYCFVIDKKNVWFVWFYSGFLEYRFVVRN